MQLVENLSQRSKDGNISNKITGLRVTFDSIWVSLEVQGNVEVLQFCMPNKVQKLDVGDKMLYEFQTKGKDRTTTRSRVEIVKLLKIDEDIQVSSEEA
jgi:hypothetical protein